TLTSRIRQTVDAIIREKPDMVLTIDSPGFAKRVIKKVRKSNMEHVPKFYHVVAPQVWAWGEKRAKKFAKIFDKLYSFFEFEKPYFTKYGLSTVAVGHPIADGLSHYAGAKPDAGSKLITLIPGSRMSEVKKLLPIFRSVAEELHAKYPDYKFIIPTVETTKKYLRGEVNKWNVRPELVPSAQRYYTYAKSYIAIAASGTVSAELAILHIPTVVVYKMNSLTMWLAKRIVKTKWVSLVNILLKKTVYPELLGDDANPEKIISEVERLSESKNRQKMISELKSADKMWRRGGNKTASRVIADDILKSI
ncbi:hypothetical protein LJC18_04965, partial [Lachnospiraceae bacterium OttesenSCG-928-E19]|nr:hypothetical protein [Lachnospiraceae bacterium OttesenSCG-928-E19]